MPSNDGSDRRRLLILEPAAEGHPREWLRHLVQSAASACGSEVWLAVAPEVEIELIPLLSSDARAHVRVISLGSTEQRLCTHRSMLVSAFARWWTMRRYLRLSGAEAGHFLSIDHLSLPFALGLGAAGRRVSGILFRPSVHYSALGSYRPTLGERLRDARKSALYRMMLLNRAVGVVLSLDPYFSEHAAQRYWRGFKVKVAPDPAHPPAPVAAQDRALAQRFPAGRIAFLLFGFLQERKGVLKLLDALPRLPSGLAERAAIMLAGRIDPGIRLEVMTRSERLASQQPALWLHIEDRRIGDGELEALIDRCDVVLAPYQRFVGSSGVLLWAARAGKPLLTQDFGLIGRLVREHGLGLAVDVFDLDTLASGLALMIREGPQRFFDPGAARSFAAERTPQRFATAIFSSLRGI